MKSSRKIILSFEIVVIASVLVLGFVGYLVMQNSDRIAEIQRLRNKAVLVSQQNTINLCHAINTLTRRDRASLRNSIKTTIPFLKALGYTDAQTANYIKLAKITIAQEIKNRPLLEHGNCYHIPKLPKST